MYRTLAATLAVMALMLAATPVSAEQNICPQGYAITEEFGCVTPDELEAERNGTTQRLTSGNTAYEDAYVDGALDALQSPEETLETLYTICGERGGVMAEDMSCIENPSEYYGGKK